MSFKTTAVITALVTFLLGVGYLVIGHLLIARWQIEPTESVLLFGRRMGAVYLGLSLIFFLARSIGASPARSALASGGVLTCSLLAVLGVYERLSGHAGSAILISAALELFLAVAFSLVIFNDRRASKAARLAA